MASYSDYFKSAYKKLKLYEQDFDISKDALQGIEDWKKSETEHGLSSLEDTTPDGVETLQVVDPDAYEEEDVQDDYVGNVVLECVSCHNLITVDESKVYEDEETGTCCPDIKCPICNAELGYTVKGKIENYDEADADEEDEEKLDFPEEPDEDEEVEEIEDDEEIEESLHDKIRRRNLQEGKDCADCEEPLEEGEDCADCDVKLPESKFVPGRGINAINKKRAEQGLPPMTDDEIDELIKKQDANRARKKSNMNDLGGIAGQPDYRVKKQDINSTRKKNSTNDLGGIAGYSKNEDLNEALNNISLDTDDQHLDISADENGRISVVSEPTGAPADDIPDTMVPGEDSIVPLDNSDREEIENNISPEQQEEILDTEAEEPTEEAPAIEEPVEGAPEEEAPEEEFGEEDFEIEEESFNYLGNTFAKKLYENVKSYKTAMKVVDKDGKVINGKEAKEAVDLATKYGSESPEAKAKLKEIGGKFVAALEDGEKLVVEGTLTFNSGKQKPTTFIFENAKETASGRLVLEGVNKTFFPTKAFKLRGKLVEGKLVCESLRYNYSINKLNESTGKQEPVAVRGIVRGK